MSGAENCNNTTDKYTIETMARHRQEKKDLQAKVQNLKKSTPKGDKKKKKEVTDIITELEREIECRHRAELSQLEDATRGESGDPNDEEPAAPVGCDQSVPENCGDDQSTVERESSQGDVAPSRISRAQKRRNKKAEDERERNKRISEEDTNERGKPRLEELANIRQSLKRFQLDLYDIPADGNCLYCAVNHQLKETGRASSDVNKLRKLTAKFMLDNRDEFLPFMYNEDEEPFNEAKFESYCKEVANTKLWGGQLELRALSNGLQVPIQVIQSQGTPTLHGGNFDGTPLVLTYHRYLYRLGEHYNSTVPATPDQPENDVTFD